MRTCMYAPRQRPGLWTANHTCKNHIRSSSSSVLAKANITSSYPIEDTSYTRLSNMNVDAYLRAIGLDRSSLGAPSRDSLHAIYRAHVQTIPFNSIPVYAGEGVDPRLDAAGLLDKLVTRGVGGVCFEHATLLWTVLQELGFNAHLMGGEVHHDGTWSPPNDHATVRVAFQDGTQFVCDPGYPLRPAEPLPLLHSGDVITQSDGRSFRLASEPLLPPEQQHQIGAANSNEQASDSTGTSGGEGTAAAAAAGGHSLWTLSMLVRGEWQVHHRFRTCPLQPAAFAGPAVGLRKEGRSFILGWMLAINGADGSISTLCTGPFAGRSVPADQAKYVMRRGVGCGAASGDAVAQQGQQGQAAAGADGREQQQGQQVTGAKVVVEERLIPLESEVELADMVSRVFRSTVGLPPPQAAHSVE